MTGDTKSNGSQTNLRPQNRQAEWLAFRFCSFYFAAGALWKTHDFQSWSQVGFDIRTICRIIKVRYHPVSYVYPVTPDHPLCGTWVAMCPDGSCESDHTEYTISVVDEQFRVTGVDPTDGEEFIIYDVGYDGESIRFVSLMPSTGRTGRNWMRIVDKDKVEYRFTFTERELWVRKPFAPKVIPSNDA